MFAEIVLTKDVVVGSNHAQAHHQNKTSTSFCIMYLLKKKITERNIKNYTYRDAFRINSSVIKSCLDQFRKVGDGSHCKDCSNSDSQPFVVEVRPSEYIL